MEVERVCLQCGDSGFTNAFIFCVRCLNFAVHRYCLPVIPDTLDEFVHWVCDDCEAKLLSPLPVHKRDVSSSPTTDHTVSIEIERFSRYETEKNNLAVVQTQTDECVHKDGHAHEQSSDTCTKLDSVESDDQLANQMQVEGKNDEHAADEYERSQLSSSFQELEEEKKIEKDLTRKSKRTLGKGKRMYQTPKERMWTPRNREIQQNVIDSTTKKDQDKLSESKRNDQTPKKRKKTTWTRKKRRRKVIQSATSTENHKLSEKNSGQSCEDVMKVETNGCSESKRKDQTPKKRKKTTWTRKKRRRKVIQSAISTENHKLSEKNSGQSCEDVMKVETNGCERLASEPTMPPEVRESNGSDGREKTCISEKNSNSNSFPISAEHTAISCNEPLRKKQKTIALSKLVSSNDHIGTREPEDKEHTVSATLRSSKICRDYPKALDLTPAEPVVLPIWRGSFSILNKKYDKLDELVAHISSKACRKVYDEAIQFQPMFQFEMLPKSKIWPKSFMTSEPSGDNIALYFFPSKISEQDFDHLVEKMISKELGLKAVVQNAELLIFTSTELPLLYWRFRGKYYLWGVFRAKQNLLSSSHSSQGELTEIPPCNSGSGGVSIS